MANTPLTPNEILALLGAVPPELKEAVEDKITACLDIAEKHYSTKLLRPAVKYDVKGNTAGWASRSGKYIRLNPTLLANNFEDYLATTVPHEVAHCIQRQLYPDSKSHGNEWRWIMWILGVEAKRCHSYETTPARVHERPWEYYCGCQTHMLTNYKHNKIQNGARYTCTKCHGELV